MCPSVTDAIASTDPHRRVTTQGEPVAVELSTYIDLRSRGVVRVLRVPETEREMRGLRFLGACSAGACVAWIFPPHLLWPIALFATGVVGYFVRRGRAIVVLGGEAPCPKCGDTQRIERSTDDFPLLHFCSSCRERSVVRPVIDASPSPSTSA